MSCSLKVWPKPGTPSRLVHRCFAGSVLPYYRGTEIMDQTVRQFLDSKLRSAPAGSPAPVSTLLTFQFQPTYTLGRRERDSFNKDASLVNHLSDGGAAAVVPTFRGGQTTFHGPGQLVAYPILDLRAFSSTTDAAGLPVRCYVELLERTIISTLRRRYGLSAMTTENTGVWVDPDHKICALGIHVRRHITSHGIALNVSTDTHRWFDRIVACGLPDKQTTSIAQQLSAGGETGVDLSVTSAAHAFAQELAESFGLELEEEYIE